MTLSTASVAGLALTLAVACSAGKPEACVVLMPPGAEVTRTEPLGTHWVAVTVDNRQAGFAHAVDTYALSCRKRQAIRIDPATAEASTIDDVTRLRTALDWDKLGVQQAFVKSHQALNRGPVLAAGAGPSKYGISTPCKSDPIWTACDGGRVAA